jgi:hypothetical protein
MPNFNNWRNWGTNILIRLGLQDQHYAHAFATVDPVYEPEEEEVDLAPTMFEWRWFRRTVRRVFKPVVKTVKKVFKPVVKTVGKAVSAVGRGVRDVVTNPKRALTNVLTFGASERERTKAKKEYAAAASEHNQALAEQKAGRAKIDKDLSEARSKWAAQKSASEAAYKVAQGKYATAKATREKSELIGKRTTAGTRAIEARKQRLAADTVKKAQEEAARRKTKEGKAGTAPGVSGVTIKPGTSLPTGRVRSKSKSGKELIERSKKGGLGGL